MCKEKWVICTGTDLCSHGNFCCLFFFRSIYLSPIDPIISRLGPGGIPWEHMSGDFSLEYTSDKEPDIQGLMACVCDFGHRLKESDSRCNQVQTGDVMTTPLV